VGCTTLRFNAEENNLTAWVKAHSENPVIPHRSEETVEPMKMVMEKRNKE
jgi:hypothetical protein